MNLINLIKIYRLQIIFIALIIIVILLVTTTIVNILSTPSTKLQPSPTPTIPSPISSKSLSSYLKTIIGKTTQKEVEGLPNLKNKTNLPGGKTQYSFHSSSPLRDDTIVAQNNKAIFEKAITVNKDLIHPTISFYIGAYGNPEAKLKGSKTYGKFETIYIYASKGFAIIGNPFTDEVDEIQTFKPMSIRNYIKLWGEDLDPNQKNQEEL